jgi:hypothetical protein
MKDISTMGMSQKAQVTKNPAEKVGLNLIDYFDVECYDRDGNFKWKETIKNLVTNQGLSYIIQAAFTGEDTAITSWYVGLKTTGAPAATDAATSLPNVGNWTEYEDYDAATRPALTLANEGGDQATDNSASPASFTIGSPAGDVYGVFVVDSASKGTNTSATVLYGVGDFSGGAKVVDPDDTLNVTVTLSAASA